MRTGEAVRLAEIIPAGQIVPELEAREKEAVIGELVGALGSSGALAEERTGEALEAVLEREKLGSTGIGNGVAVPHAKLSGLEGVVGALGKAPGGIDFDSLDGAPVRSVFLFLSPEETPDAHVTLMSRFVSLIRKPDFLNFLDQTHGREALHDLLAEVDGWE